MTSLRARTLSLSLVTGLLVSLALVLVPTAPASAAAQGITGQVTGPGGVPLPGIEVDFLQEIYPDVWAPVESAVTDSSGNYAAALSARTWRVGFADYDNGAYLSEFYDDVASIDDASDVLVSDGDVVENVDAELSVASHITGSISGSDAPGVPYADVYGYVLDVGTHSPPSRT
jgi:hypothetical protein